MISWFEKRNKLSWLTTIIIAIGIFYASSLTSIPQTLGLGVRSLIYHITAFFLLAIFLLISIAKGRDSNLIFLAIAIAIIYSFSDEFHQLFVPGRVAALSDVFIDLFGITLSLIVYSISLELRTTVKKF